MAAPYDVMKPKTEAYPNRLEVNQFNCGKSYAWLKQYGLTDEEIEENFFFAPISDRHVFVCRDPDTNDEFFEARSPVKNITPKTLQYGTKPNLFMGDLTSEYLVIVQDVVSAKPATYSIRVAGYLDKNWSDRMGGLKINPTIQEGKTAITTITGSIIDQAALFGVLNALYDMRLPLLSVECFDVK